MNHSTEVIDSLYFMGLKQGLWAKEGYTTEVCVYVEAREFCLSLCVSLSLSLSLSLCQSPWR